jgi:hypothetical protein
VPGRELRLDEMEMGLPESRRPGPALPARHFPAARARREPRRGRLSARLVLGTELSGRHDGPGVRRCTGQEVRPLP